MSYFGTVISLLQSRSTPVAQSAPRNLLTRWDVSSIPANGIFLTKNKKTKIKMSNGWRTINSLLHKIRLHGRRGKGMAESFSRQKSRHAPQKEGGLKILCDLPPDSVTPAGTSNELDVQNGWEENTHTHSLLTVAVYGEGDLTVGLPSALGSGARRRAQGRGSSEIEPRYAVRPLPPSPVCRCWK